MQINREKIHALSKPHCVFTLPGLTCFPKNQQDEAEAAEGEQLEELV